MEDKGGASQDKVERAGDFRLGRGEGIDGGINLKPSGTLAVGKKGCSMMWGMG